MNIILIHIFASLRIFEFMLNIIPSLHPSKSLGYKSYKIDGQNIKTIISIIWPKVIDI